jgi:replicative DNA helicase
MSTHEQAALGCILVDPTLLDELGEYCTIDDFIDDQAKYCVKLAQQVSEEGSEPNLINMSAKLRSTTDQHRASNLIKYLATILKNTPSARAFRDYARGVRQEADTRRLVDAAQEVLDVARDPLRPLEERLDACQQTMLDAVERKEDTLKESRQQVVELVNALERRMEAGGQIGLQTGFTQLDQMIIGMKEGQMITLAGRPAMGKSVLALNLFSTVIKSGKTALYVSLEMTSEELTSRLASDWSKIFATNISRGQLDNDEWQRFTNCFGAQYPKLNAVIDDSSTQTMGSIRAKARRVAKKHGGLDLLIIDHIGLIDHGYENETQGLSKISREIKRLAKDLECPILALSQINRSCEQRPNKRPMLSDLRQSGSIEQDSDTVMMLYRDEYYNKESEHKRIAELILTKVRGGETGTALLKTEFEYSRFANTEEVFNEDMTNIEGKSNGFDY